MAILPQLIATSAIDHPTVADGHDVMAKREIEDCIHPNLRESFVKFPAVGIPLTNEQLEAIFGGDLRALRDIAALLCGSVEIQNNNDY